MKWPKCGRFDTGFTVHNYVHSRLHKCKYIHIHTYIHTKKNANLAATRWSHSPGRARMPVH